MKHECRKGEADAAMKQDYQIFLIFLLQRMLHASCLLHLLHGCSHSACFCFCVCFSFCVCFTSVNQALVIYSDCSLYSLIYYGPFDHIVTLPCFTCQLSTNPFKCLHFAPPLLPKSFIFNIFLKHASNSILEIHQIQISNLTVLIAVLFL